MESIKEAKILERSKAFEDWLHNDCDLGPFALQPLPLDASFRRYFRIHTPISSYVAMDAPPPHENCRPFVAIANALRELKLNTPNIIAANLDHGFLLLTDFGDLTYLKTLNCQNANELYTLALDALFVLKDCRTVNGHTIPLFSREIMMREWQDHKDWFLNKLLKLKFCPLEEKLDACYEMIVDSAVSQPQVFMHRDYHSANLMVLRDHSDPLRTALADPRIQGVGILDFQDAFIGPITYDAVSLLRDCYIDWSDERVNRWVLYYWQKLKNSGHTSCSKDEFMRWFDWIGLQRHLKALLTFARKYVRDNEPRYLKYIPRTLNYLRKVTERYPEFTILNQHLVTTVQPAFARTITVCAQ